MRGAQVGEIDGQQRLTPSPALTASPKCSRSCQKSSRKPIEGFAPDMVATYYLIQPAQKGHKTLSSLLLSDTIRTTLKRSGGKDAGAPLPRSPRISHHR